MQSFLGLANYYRDHIPSFAVISVLLSEQTRKGLLERERWDNPQEKVFVALRKNMLLRPALRLPDHAKLFVPRTNASNCGLGAALMQEQYENYYPVAYGSKKLTSAERRYSTLENECLAIVWSVSKFQLYLAGKPFILQTDYQSLIFLNDAKFKNDPIMRWTLALQEYNYTLKNIPGKSNVWADCLIVAT